jgi:hypothetical protein
MDLIVSRFLEWYDTWILSRATDSSKVSTDIEFFTFLRPSLLVAILFGIVVTFVSLFTLLLGYLMSWGDTVSSSLLWILIGILTAITFTLIFLWVTEALLFRQYIEERRNIR